MPTEHVAVGVDATPGGWVAVRYHDGEYESVHRYVDPEIENAETTSGSQNTEITRDTESAFLKCWHEHRDADVVLVDVPIGLPADRPARQPEREARSVLGLRRASVFNVPIRPILHVDDYDEANRIQKERTGKGLMRQTFNILPRIREVDAVLGDPDLDATQDVVREAHPEVCFWALTDGDTPMLYSKTGQPAAAHWERVGVLASVHDAADGHAETDGTFQAALADAGGTLLDWTDPELSNDDLLDAFALAITSSELTEALRTLPEDPDTDEMGLRMEMAYAPPR